MSQKKQHGRRRADTRVKTPLTELTAALNANSGVVGRRAAVVAAAGGLAAAAGMPSALASTHHDAGQAVDSSSKTQKVSYEAQGSHKVDAPAKADGANAVTVSVKASKAPKPVQTEETTSTSSDSTSSSSHKSSTGSSHSDSKSHSGSNSDSGSSSSKLPDGSKAQQVIALAKQGVGTPYVSGGSSPSGWDCSGFTSYVYGKVGVSLPRTADAQHGAGHIVSRSEAKAGDIIWSPGHVGIYAGNGMMYDAGNPRVNTTHRSIDWMVSEGAQFVRVL